MIIGPGINTYCPAMKISTSPLCLSRRSVSVAGTGGGLWAVEGGNQRVPETLLKQSGASVVFRPVTSVTRLSPGKIAVAVAARSDIPPEGEKVLVFDAVIIATPQTADMRHRIAFMGFEETISFDGRYHRTVCTVLRGDLRREQFPGVLPYTDEVITTSEGPFFNSISRIYPVDSDKDINKSDVWKVFSQKPLKPEELSSLFVNSRDVTVVDWLAYPHYLSKSRHDKFLLSPGLYHINAIEWAASAMEMSLVGAKNVVNLLRRDWCLQNDCPQPVKRSSTLNEEL